MAYEEHIQSAEQIVARCAVITLSDTRTEETDTSGQTIRSLLESNGHAVADYTILKDDAALLDEKLLSLIGSPEIDAILIRSGD